MRTRRTADEIIRDDLEYVTKQVAKGLLGIKSDKTLRRLRQEGNFVCVLRGNTFMYSLDSIHRYFKRNKAYYGRLYNEVK